MHLIHSEHPLQRTPDAPCAGKPACQALRWSTFRAANGSFSERRAHVGDRAIASTRAQPAARYLRRPGRRDHHPRVSRARGLVDGDRVVGRVPRDAGDAAGRRADQAGAHSRVIDRGFRQRMPDDQAGAVDTQMELLPAPRATSAVFSRRPTPLDQPLKVRCRRRSDAAVLGRDVVHRDMQHLTPSRERRVVRSVETGTHHGQVDRTNPSVCRKGNRKTSRSLRAVSMARSENRCCRPADQLAELPTRPWRLGRATASRRLAGRVRARTPANPHTVARLVGWMDLGLHPPSMPQGPGTPTDPRLSAERRLASRAPTPRVARADQRDAGDGESMRREELGQHDIEMTGALRPPA